MIRREWMLCLLDHIEACMADTETEDEKKLMFVIALTIRNHTEVVEKGST